MDDPLPTYRDHDSTDRLQADHDHGPHHTMTLDPLKSMHTTSTSTEPPIDGSTHAREATATKPLRWICHLLERKGIAAARAFPRG